MATAASRRPLEGPAEKERQDMVDTATENENAMQSLMAEVRMEPYDSRWAELAEQSLHEVEGVEPDGVECRSRRCVVEASAQDPISAEQLRLSLIRAGRAGGLRRLRIRSTRTSTGGTRMRAVLAREGYRVSGDVDRSR